ncbi:protein inturned isoform X1 [Nematostella vectensis]|uniref:protein inturned isoform X1 n=2 Tax=Nematostella vectensis TaxID=45351 RepID=UPI0020776E03|nr:protein inturned isoform X1 [Nematostella vectensis]
MEFGSAFVTRDRQTAMRTDLGRFTGRSTLSRWPPIKQRRCRRSSSAGSFSLKSYDEPPWADQVKDKGDLFYVEPYTEPSSSLLNEIEHLNLSGNSTPDRSTERQKSKAVLKKLSSVKKILRRDKNEETMDKKNLRNSLNLDGQDILDGGEGMTGKSIKMDIHLIVTPPKLHSGRRQDLETLLGIIPGRDKAGRMSQSDSFSGSRIFIKGFVPDGPALKSGELRIGDLILSLNKLDLNSSNMNTILAAITGPMEIILTIQRYTQPVNPVITSNVPMKDDSHLIKLISGELAVVQGQPDLLDLAHVVLYLSMGSSEDEDDDKDIVYQYPVSKSGAQLVAMRGIFLTLNDLLSSVTGTNVQSTSLTISGKVINIGYYKAGKRILVLAMPADKVPLLYLQKIVSDISRTLFTIFGSMDRAFSESTNKGRLDHFFSLLFSNTLGKSCSREHTGAVDSFPDCLPGVRWLNLPIAAMVNINCCLSELEAADYGELADELFEIRRVYTILGSCVFYKGILLANHLFSEDFEDITLYCKYYCLLDVGKQQRVGQLVVWREVHLTRRHKKESRKSQDYKEPDARHFLLIVGLKHILMCVLLEAGGAAKWAQGTPGPDPYYVEQVKNTIMQIETQDLASICEASLRSAPTPPLTTADIILSASSSSAPSDRSSTSGNILSPSTPPMWRKHNSLESLRLPGDEIDSSDSGSLPSAFRRRGSDSSGSVSSLTARGKLRSYRSLSSLQSCGSLRKSMTEGNLDPAHAHITRLTAGPDNTLFHFVTFDSLSGVVVCPTSSDTVPRQGTVHADVLRTFHETCLNIRRFFLPFYKQKRSSSRTKGKVAAFSKCGPEGVFEHGAMFQCVPENTTDHKKASPTLKYWVIGRLFPGKHPKEFYVCYHNIVPQCAVEIAFKLGFGVTP